jgi:hypothetical protein
MGWLRRRGVVDREPSRVDEPAEPLPVHDPRAMLEDWLRALTIVGEGHAPAEALALLARVNQPQTVQVRIRTPLPPEDAQALRDSLAWQHEARSRQAGVNLMVEDRLIRWLAEATGQSWSEIVQRLARDLNTVLPPD